MDSSEENKRRELALLSLAGLSVGDAFGERFLVSPQIANRLIEARALPSAPWRWTDDTAMALAVVENLFRHGRINPDTLAESFSQRYADEPGRGYGQGAMQLLRSVCLGTPWRDASAQLFDGQGSFGNGGAMRSAPIGAFFWDSYELVVENAAASAEPTHSHPEGRAGAIAVAVAAAAAIRIGKGEDEAIGENIFDAVLRHCPPGETYAGLKRASEIPLSDDALEVAASLGNGSRVSSQDTVPFCVWSAAKYLESYGEALWGTVGVLGDCDTTCAIVGGIVALAVGHDGIPSEFIAAREHLPEEIHEW